MASVKVVRRGPSRAEARAAAERLQAASGTAARRREIERRVSELAREETRLACEGFYEGAQAAARERRYWEFLRALLDAPLGPGEPGATMH